MKRKVKVFKYEREGSLVNKVYMCDGIFHEFGCNYEEFENSTGNYSTAIVELSTGEVLNVPVEMIWFYDTIIPSKYEKSAE